MSYKLFAFCGFFGLVILSPIKFSVYYSKNDMVKNLDDDPVDLPIEIPESFGVLVSYVIFTWVFSLATFYFTFYNYREFSEVRHRYYCKWKNSITTRTVMVTVIPKELQTDQALKEFYESLELGPVKEAVVYRNVRKLRHALEKRAYYLRKLERSYAEYLGNPCTYPNYDPNEALAEFDQDRTIDLSKFVNKHRQKTRTGFLGIFGKEVDKIDYYTNLFDRFDKLVEKGRHGTYNPTSVGFVTFESITSAQHKSLYALNHIIVVPRLHPSPVMCRLKVTFKKQITSGDTNDKNFSTLSLSFSYWRNLTIRQREMLLRSIIVNVAVVIMVIFWSVITTLLSSMLSLDALKEILPWLARLANKNKVLKGFIQGTVPTLLVLLFDAMVPKAMSCRYLL
ncbi:9758_t:CDS:2 [Acaulospora colombiana]|uniref:9758_t:CDS:1 n=1 Tax=Acaulospora colombiana TaxID=27376 RepID=A0ACA9KNE5_9GLOM|nr:9758_t:CDS:2 [Acaulospora colombiana]